MSHVRGTGRTLREHGSRAVAQLLSAKSMRASEQSLPHMLFGVNIVEAFPNTFLGVVLAEEDFLAAGQIKRGGKFDWLYDRWIEHRLFNAIIDAAHLPSTLIASCEMEHDHEIRAALVCLLTAGLVRAGNYKVVGDETSGYFFLPPLSLWAPWARREIAEVSA
jgi:hypothetical protein